MLTLARPIKAESVFKAKHGAVVGAHQVMAVIGPEDSRFVIEWNRIMGAPINITPNLFTTPEQKNTEPVMLRAKGALVSPSLRNVG